MMIQESRRGEKIKIRCVGIDTVYTQILYIHVDASCILCCFLMFHRKKCQI